MAQVGRLMRKSQEENEKDLEASARAKMNAEAKEKAKEEQLAKKLEAERKSDAVQSSAFSKGVFSMLSDDFQEEATSPVVLRPEMEGKPAVSVMAYPASEQKPKAEPKKVPQSAWAPAGMNETRSSGSSAKDTIAKALEGIVDLSVAPDQVGPTGVEAAIKALSDLLTAERQRSAAAEERAARAEARLEAQAEIAEAKLANETKAVERLERENERLQRECDRLHKSLEEKPAQSV